MKLVLLGLLLLVLCFVALRMFREASQSRDADPELGLFNGQLKACPSSPNCVNSFASDERHGIEPLQGSAEDFRALVAFIAEAPNAEISVLSNNYVQAQYKSGLFGFVDDLELYHDGSQIQVRSASRAGHSDLGVNRARVETLRMYLKDH